MHHFIAISEFKLELRVRKRPIRVKIGHFLATVTLKFDGWPWKTIGHLSYATSSFVHHFIAISVFKLELRVRKCPIRVKIGHFLAPVTLKFSGWPWQNNRAPLLCYFKLCASFHSHKWIQTGVRVRKRSISVKICFDLCDLDLRPWPFAWTSLLAMVITPENFMVIWWWEHSEKGATDGRTEPFIELLGHS